ncbi:tetratricopeptide repeat-containing diguanylate cyclase [Pseudodesulfovibrio piezophilus]|uniref:Diguanylate cyclase and serine/threonine protein kinase with TPR repeats n=1 Tax=Pseudodesulfovibrio piezophilus (strain DSM 21447 / JCM 15486 / C1TLV30) TaxID=1322246 RepID=M1WJX8_PSEP2|nr:GGDEF domain-containing protein [Pseudodesulfovibrio piezophilus]CCH48661.1 Diguanylate cyclase and serine/threonine protein kinase with TPR repeats [Pseudodesulfovibrio piezophilus C1TLV30]
MRTIKDIFSNGSLSFTPQELIDFEHTIKDCIAEFLPFTSYSLFFPRDHPGTPIPEPEFRVADRELILPLVFQGRMLCYFIAKGVKLKAPGTAPKYIMALASSVLEKIALYKKSVTDPLTGLFSRDYFMDELEKSIDQVQGCIETGSCPTDMEAAEVDVAFSGTLGVLFLDLDGFQWINEHYGYLKGDDILSEVGRLLDLVCPKYTTVARFSNDKFAILVPDAKPRASFQLSEVIRSGIGKLSFTDDITNDTISISGSVGFVNYPQGLEGAQFRRTASEQARMLVRKARKGVAVAKDQGRNRVFGYADILSKGGRVLEVLPMNRMLVSLGETTGAKVGQRFLVRSPKSGTATSASLTEDERIVGRYPAMYKGEIVLVEVQDEIAFAEVLHLGDATTTLVAGDRLKLVSGDDSLFIDLGAKDEETHRDVATRLYSYSDFIANFASARLAPETFGLSLLRVLDQPSDTGERYQEAMEQMVSDIATLARGAFNESALGGRYGLNGMVFFQEGVDAEIIRRQSLEIERLAKDTFGLRVAVGAAVYPFLKFSRSDILENCRKALEHALLLPEPRVAVFDSISLNLSADRRFMDGDVYGAIEEFKLALLDDENNLLARNSLGICFAQLGRFEDARKHFEGVLQFEEKDMLALYNLGWANHRLGDLEKAEQAYRECLKIEPNHVYSLMRLGTIEENGGFFDKASSLYKRAADLPGGERMVLRPLARVSYRLGDIEATREYLHLALNADHNDHQAMHMLAKLYLDKGEDPQIAEVLARQSAALSPGKDAYWDVLVEALEAQGKGEEAIKVAARAAG